MGDQLKSGISVDVNFVSGETPSPAKLTAITAQVRRAALECEQAIGDVHGESYPYTSAAPTTLSQAHGKHPTTGNILSGADERKLDIANLARLIGPSSNLNPRMINGEQTIEEQVPVGVHEFQLEYPISGALLDVTSTDPTMTLQRADEDNLQTAGDWAVTRGGKVFCVTETDGGIITYLTNSSEWNGGQNPQRSAFNVIPDPNQITNGSGCAIGALDGQGRRPVTLPVCTHQQSDIDGLSVVLDEQDVNFERQLLLPRVLRDNLTSGDEIPTGFLYLKNETTGEVYEDGVYYYNSTSSVLVGNVSLTAAIAAGNKFSVITVGNDITTSIDDLRVKHFHSHDRSHGEPFVPVTAIAGQFESAGDSGVFGPSENPSNPFPQYLHRDGARSADISNINDRNAMRGDILFGIESGDPGNYVDDTGDTFGVWWGALTGDSAYMRKEGGSEDLKVFNGGRHIVLEVDNDVVAETSPSSKNIQIKGGPLTSDFGYRAPFATKPGANVGIFCVQATWTTPGSLGSFADVGASLAGTPLSEVDDKFWVSVQMFIQETGGNNLWYPPNLTVGPGSAGDRLWEFYHDRPVSTSRLIAAIHGGDWNTTTAYPISIVIHYLP